MKTNITICIDHELVHKLRQEGGISSTINALLQQHIFGGNSKDGIKLAIKEKEGILLKTTDEIKVLRERLIKANKPVVRYGV